MKIFKEENVEYAVVHEDEKITGIITQDELLEAYYHQLTLTENIKTIINDNICFINNNCRLDKATDLLEKDPDIYIITGNNPGEAAGVITGEVISDYFHAETEEKIKELNQAFEYSPNAFVILDGDGNTVRVNKEFENITDIKKEDVTGKNVREMEEKGIYNPSVGVLILKENRKISIIQKLPNGKEALVTGIPIHDQEGNIFRIIINSIDFKELNIINEYFSKQKKISLDQQKDRDIKIIHESDCMKKIVQLTHDLKNVDSTVLITGESGVGKGIIARRLHNNSIRKNEKMVEINCGAIPEALLESELFGYEAGAFTGAKKGGKLGLIELANKGTLFLDEIGEMSMELQIKLLQVIQERKIIRVGGVKPIDIDVRIIAATNQDLQELINRGKFRSDLFYRLNVIPINIPPLRERQLDIIPLVEYFLDKYNKKYNKQVVIGGSILNMMIEYNWPGNVRELENTIERLVVTNPSELIEKDTITTNIFNSNIYKNNYVSSSNLIDNIVPLKEAKKEVEEKLIKMAYQKYKSSYKVAEILKISQPTAYRKISKYISANER